MTLADLIAPQAAESMPVWVQRNMELTNKTVGLAAKDWRERRVQVICPPTLSAFFASTRDLTGIT